MERKNFSPQDFAKGTSLQDCAGTFVELKLCGGESLMSKRKYYAPRAEKVEAEAVSLLVRSGDEYIDADSKESSIWDLEQEGSEQSSGGHKSLWE